MTITFTSDNMTSTEVLDHITTESIGGDDYHVPFEIPQCPPNSTLLNLYFDSDEAIEAFLYSKLDKIIIRTVSPFIIALGLMTNCAFLFTLAMVREMRTYTNVYLANLAFADLFFMFNMAWGYTYLGTTNFRNEAAGYTTAGCVTAVVATYVPYFASLGLITVVGVERFLAICHPLKYRLMATKSRTVKIVMALWFCAFALAALVAPNYSKFQRLCIIWPEKWQNRLPNVIRYCNSVKWQFFYIAAFVQFVPFILALFLDIILYSFIIRCLSQREVSDQGRCNIRLQNQNRKVRNTVAQMLVINGIAFFLCMTPFQLLWFVNILNFSGFKVLDNNTMEILLWISRCMMQLNSAINPIIYGITNTRYRQAFVTALSCSSTTSGISKPERYLNNTSLDQINQDDTRM